MHRSGTELIHFQEDELINKLNVEWRQVRANTGTMDTLTRLNHEFGAMRSTLDQSAVSIQKHIGLPVQGNTGMRTTVFIGVYFI